MKGIWKKEIKGIRKKEMKGIWKLGFIENDILYCYNTYCAYDASYITVTKKVVSCYYHIIDESWERYS